MKIRLEVLNRSHLAAIERNRSSAALEAGYFTSRNSRRCSSLKPRSIRRSARTSAL